MTMTADGSRFVNMSAEERARYDALSAGYPPIGTPWPDRPISERSLRVAMTGYVHDDDPTIIADMQQELDRVPQAIRAAENDAIERAAQKVEERFHLIASGLTFTAMGAVLEALPDAIRALKQPETTP